MDCTLEQLSRRSLPPSSSLTNDRHSSRLLDARALPLQKFNVIFVRSPALRPRMIRLDMRVEILIISAQHHPILEFLPPCPSPRTLPLLLPLPRPRAGRNFTTAPVQLAVANLERRFSKLGFCPGPRVAEFCVRAFRGVGEGIETVVIAEAVAGVEGL